MATASAPTSAFPTRAAMAGALPANLDHCFLTEPGREGSFVFRSANLATEVRGDPLQGLYIPPGADRTGSSGAWVRIHDGTGRPEWFYNGEWADAIEACFRLMPHTQLGMQYVVGRTVKLTTPNRSMEGMGGIDYDGKRGTRIILSSGSGDVMQVGPDANPGGNPGVTFLRGVKLRNVQLTRGATLVPADSIARSPAGIRCQYLYDCDIDVYSWENSVGCNIRGCVSSRIACFAHSALDARSANNDVAIGTYIDGTANIGLAGGNASIRVRPQSSIYVTGAPVRKGVYAYGHLADLTLDRAETVGCAISIHLQATGTAANNVDIRLIEPTMDQPSEKGLVLEDFPAGSQMDVISPYVGVPSSASHAIDVLNSAADISILGGQLIGAAGGTTAGLRVMGSRAVSIVGTKVLNFPNPLFLDGAADCDVQPMVSNPDASAVAFAVGLRGNCARTRVDPTVSGKTAAFPAAVTLFTGDTTNVRINIERVDASAVSAGRKLILGKTNVTTDGRYLANGTADAAGTIRVEGAIEGDVALPAGKVVKINGDQVLTSRQKKAGKADPRRRRQPARHPRPVGLTRSINLSSPACTRRSRCDGAGEVCSCSSSSGRHISAHSRSSSSRRNSSVGNSRSCTLDMNSCGPRNRTGCSCSCMGCSRTSKANSRSHNIERRLGWRRKRQRRPRTRTTIYAWHFLRFARGKPIRSEL